MKRNEKSIQLASLCIHGIDFRCGLKRILKVQKKSVTPKTLQRKRLGVID